MWTSWLGRSVGNREIALLLVRKSRGAGRGQAIVKRMSGVREPDHGRDHDAHPALITLVDLNVLLDVLTDDPRWAKRWGDALARAADAGRLAINPIVYAEVSVGFGSVEDLDAALPADVFERHHLPWEAASWPPSASSGTAAVGASVGRRSRTSMSAHTRRSRASPC